jgi:hypothetical protein
LSIFKIVASLMSELIIFFRSNLKTGAFYGIMWKKTLTCFSVFCFSFAGG